ncbi:hypothetical protein CNMCM8812_001588 [Aspergillus fumigatus]|nr:hypothetical protein CNMCM8812_001588 [Aspergillus fumigatus]KAH2986541.1 hypothetical protein KXW58_008008 [Aspergillus fumigatus]
MPSKESFSASNGHLQDGWSVDPSQFAFTPRKLRVVCIGAGFSGLILAYKLKHERPIDFVDYTIYEKNPEVGGTWYENVYPGVGCDIPAPMSSHLSQIPIGPSSMSADQRSKTYIVKTTDKYGLRDKITFNTKLLQAAWDEGDGKWKLTLEQGGSLIEDVADIVVDGSGILNQWKWPDVEGLNLFQGKLLHSARWDPDYDWTGKGIAVIGNGSSALQIVPELQPKAAKIVNYIRRATWVSTNLCGNLTKDGMGTNFEFTKEDKQRFRDDPEEFLKYRKVVEASVNSVFRLMLSGSEENRFLFKLVDSVMRARLSKDPELADKLIPKYEIGCRRLSPGDGYLEALQADNAEIRFDSIQRITETGIQTDKGIEEFDLIVCATGFNASFIPAWDLVGRDGRRLDEEWKEKPEAYFSVCAAGIPNYFISVVVKDSVVSDYNIYAQENLKRAVWSKGCHAWYSKKTTGEGVTVTAMYPGSVLHYKAVLRTIRGEHFDIRYNTTNPFRYLGNGELAFEREKGADLAFYLK